MEVVETTSPDINPEILAHLDPSLHPPGNTKVTTTIKTYTYEIPGSGNYPTNLHNSSAETEKYVYSPNQSQSTPSKSFVFKKYENQSSENTVNYIPYQKPVGPVKETITTTTYQPGYVPDSPPSRNQTYIYNETTTTRNVDNTRGSLPRNQNYQPPPKQDTYIVKEVHENNTYNRQYPDYPPPSQQHYIKEIHDSSTTTNVHHPYPNGYPANEPNKTVIYKHETHTTNNYGRPGKDVESFDPKHPPYPHDRRPNEPVNIQYRYKSESKTTNNYKAGYPPSDDTQPLLPKPFPTENHPDGPPKRLDELMATIGHEVRIN